MKKIQFLFLFLLFFFSLFSGSSQMASVSSNIDDFGDSNNIFDSGTVFFKMSELKEINGVISQNPFKSPVRASYTVNHEVCDLPKGEIFVCPSGTSVYASMGGRVIETGYNATFGNYMILQHISGYRTLYGHLSAILTKTGAYVNQDSRIGKVGSTGNSKEAHLHFVLYKNGVAKAAQVDKKIETYSSKTSFEIADEFEASKNWVYALGAYYDAIEKNDSNSKNALERFLKISGEIRKGKPGLEEMDDFDIHDEWKKICVQFEKYWSENCPRNFAFSKIQRSILDYENRTASYEFELTSEITEKFVEMTKVFREGFVNARRADWVDMGKDWLNDEYELVSGKILESRKVEYSRFEPNHHTVYKSYVFDEKAFIIDFEVNDDDGTLIFSGSCKAGEKFRTSQLDKLRMKILDNQKIVISPKQLKVLNVRTFSVEDVYISDPYTKTSLRKKILKS